MATNSNGEQYTPGKCFECRGGEHEDYDDDVQMVYIRDPSTKKVITRGRMCSEHRCMYGDDGYIVEFK